MARRCGFEPHGGFSRLPSRASASRSRARYFRRSRISAKRARQVGSDCGPRDLSPGGHWSAVSIALDTMVLVWGGLRPPISKKTAASAHVAEMEFRSRVLIRDLEDRGEKVIIPTIAVAELLTPLEPRQHGQFIATLTDRFFCPPFDLRAAAMAAQLWQWHRGLPAEEQIQRSVLKADVLIISVAKVAGASSFIVTTQSPGSSRLTLE
jgi:hypothetical protein